jgi:hypothetical protein
VDQRRDSQGRIGDASGDDDVSPRGQSLDDGKGAEVDVGTLHTVEVVGQRSIGGHVGEGVSVLDQRRKVRQDVVAADGGHREAETELAHDLVDGDRTCLGVDASGVRDDLDVVLDAVRQDPPQLGDEVRRIAGLRVPRAELLHDAHRHLGQEVHREVVDPPTADELHRPSSGVTPEALTVADSHHRLRHRHLSLSERRFTIDLM